MSGEVYDYSIKLLRRFVSEEELPELTVEKIQDFLRRLDAAESKVPNTQAPCTEGVQRGNHGPFENMDQDVTNETIEGDEHPVLQERLGCMLLDSMGKYRQCLLRLDLKALLTKSQATSGRTHRSAGSTRSTQHESHEKLRLGQTQKSLPH